MRLAVIPARGGSKRVPGKNIRSFCGKPIIAWSIEAAIESGCFDRIVVSTDSSAIARVAVDCGAEVPFMRPAELADDWTATAPVVRHAIDWFASSGEDPTYACCIYATAPFITAADLRHGWKLLASSDCDYSFSLTTFAFPVQRALRITSDGRIEMFNPEAINTRSQDLAEACHDAGQFYWGRAAAWRAERPIFGPASLPVFLPRHRVQDIDTLEDWTRAELMFKALEGTKDAAS